MTSRRMLKIVWTGQKLSTDEQDGAWESGYEWTPDEKALAAGSISRGSGTTPTLMGFGDDPDKLVVIADAAESGTNLVAFWRDEIPADFTQKPGTKSRRIADQARIEISQLTIEPSANVLGYGVAVINGSYPQPYKVPGFPNAFTAGVTRPAPLGIEKFEWNPKSRGSRRRGSTPRSTTPTSWCRSSRRRPACCMRTQGQRQLPVRRSRLDDRRHCASAGSSLTTAASGMPSAASRRSSRTAIC